MNENSPLTLKHYYHIYADGDWTNPFHEHLTALDVSGLEDELSFIGVGIVGTDQNRNHVKKELPQKFHIVAESLGGWEQVTHTPLSQDVKEPSKILYAHTKGAANSGHSQNSWRREMTDVTVYHWKECVKLLDENDAVGCRWRRDPWRHFSGTFWWATSSFISSLAPISYTHRDDAEAWIGYGSLGGTHAEITAFHPELSFTVHPFGRTFVCGRTRTGESYSNNYEIGEPKEGDEFVGYSPIELVNLVSHLVTNGAKCSIKGNTIIVESV